MTRKYAAWSPEMDAYMVEHYATSTNKDIAAHLGITTENVLYRSKALRLFKDGATRSICSGKIELTPVMEQYIRDNWDTMTNPELATGLGLTLTVTRNFIYSMGLKRMELEYWTPDQIEYLKENYKTTGDVELAETFGKLWPKNKGWSKKHIEKKRRYMVLKRSKDEINAIQDRNVELGRFLHCPDARWLKYGVSKNGDIRMWRSHNGRYVPFIKVDGKFIHWARYTWEQAYGPVAPGINIVFKNNNPGDYEQGISVLEAITDSELSRRNSKIGSTGLSDNYVAGMLSHGRPEIRNDIKNMPELIQLKRTELLLNRAIKQQENGNQPK